MNFYYIWRQKLSIEELIETILNNSDGIAWSSNLKNIKKYLKQFPPDYTIYHINYTQNYTEMPA